MILLVDSKGPDQTKRMCRLIWAFAVRLYRRTFLHGAAHITLKAKARQYITETRLNKQRKLHQKYRDWIALSKHTGGLNLVVKTSGIIQLKKKVREKSRECLNHKPQPFPDTKRKRKSTNPNKHKSNKRTKSTKISSLFPKRGNRNTKRTEKHKN